MELSHTRGQTTAPFNRLVQFLRRHPLLFYFLMAFSFTWVYELLVFGILHLPFNSLWVLLLTLVGPTLAAFFTTVAAQGRASILQFLRRYILWRVGISWYLVALLGVPVLLLIPYLIQPGAISTFRQPGLTLWLISPIGYLAMLVLGDHSWRNQDGVASRSPASSSDTVR